MTTAFDRFLVHDVDLLAPVTTTNRYGDTVADWDQPPTTTSVKGWFTRTDTDEMADGREAITDVFELSLAADVPITDDMRVVRLGDTYEIRGSVERAEAPEGTHHQIIRLRRVAG
jgi:head-tail adaptor